VEYATGEAAAGIEMVVLLPPALASVHGGEQTQELWRGRTSSHGTLVLPHLQRFVAPDQLFVFSSGGLLQADRLPLLTVAVPWSARQELVLHPDLSDTKERLFRLPELATVELVPGPAPLAIPGSTVHLQVEDLLFSWPAQQSFRLRAAAGEALILQASLEGYGQTRLSAQAPAAPGGIRQVSWDWPAGSRIRARVLLSGQPLINTQLFSSLTAADHPEIFQSDYERGSEHRWHFTGPDGEVLLGGSGLWPAGEKIDWRLQQPTSPSLQQGFRNSLRLELEATAGGEIQLGEIHLQPLPLLLAGRITDADQNSIAGAQVLVSERGGRSWSEPTDADGRFFIYGRSSRPLQWRAFHPRYQASRNQPAKAGDRSHRARLQPRPRGQFLGKLLLPSGCPVEVLAVALDGVEKEVSAGGWFHFEHCDPGTSKLQLRLRWEHSPCLDLGEVSTKPTATSPERATPHFFDVRNKLSVRTLQLRDDRGEPAAAVQAFQVHSSGASRCIARSDSRGQLTLLAAQPPAEVWLARTGLRLLRLPWPASQLQRLQLDPALEVQLQVPQETWDLLADRLVFGHLRFVAKAPPAEVVQSACPRLAPVGGDGSCVLQVPVPGAYEAGWKSSADGPFLAPPLPVGVALGERLTVTPSLAPEDLPSP
jgi:hypothetical protein